MAAPRRGRFRRSGDEGSNSPCARTAARATDPPPPRARFILLFCINVTLKHTPMDYLPPFLSSRTALGWGPLSFFFRQLQSPAWFVIILIMIIVIHLLNNNNNQQ